MELSVLIWIFGFVPVHPGVRSARVLEVPLSRISPPAL